MITETVAARRITWVRKAFREGRARALREAARLSQNDIARIAGVSRVAVSQWEQGDKAPRREPALRCYPLLRELEQAASEHERPPDDAVAAFAPRARRTSGGGGSLMSTKRSTRIAYHRPDDRRAPERDESLSDWLARQQNPVRATVAGNAAILARLEGRTR